MEGVFKIPSGDYKFDPDHRQINWTKKATEEAFNLEWNFFVTNKIYIHQKVLITSIDREHPNASPEEKYEMFKKDFESWFDQERTNFLALYPDIWYKMGNLIDKDRWNELCEHYLHSL
jgi:hypothetical protein